ncbi:hypothetical protein [Gaopeijia maritima]|uniref:hypothetical protein n=1 Tax=Gaopeijia maritima TaxID=3119007 RepID=UPI00328D3F01
MQIAKRRKTNTSVYFSRASSESGEQIQQRLTELVARIQAARRGVAFNELMNLFVECSQVDWDGDGAERIDVEVFHNARIFLETLPTAFPSPEVSAGCEGEVAFDWFPAPRSNFSVLIVPGGKVIYAGAERDRKFSGIARFDDRVPRAILDELRQLF